jgi:GT2 family glycosyltransferase
MFDSFLSYIPQVGSLLVRREVVEAVGGFEAELQGGEDWDWALRIARHCQIGFVPKVALLWRMHTIVRVDGAGNRRVEDITWRRYTDVIKVARRYTPRSSLPSWLKAQRIILKHKGHYIPLFIGFAQTYARAGDMMRALYCYWLAVRVSPLHVASHNARALTRSARHNPV